jgi:hypothetical protein
MKPIHVYFCIIPSLVADFCVLRDFDIISAVSNGCNPYRRSTISTIYPEALSSPDALFSESV